MRSRRRNSNLLLMKSIMVVRRCSPSSKIPGRFLYAHIFCEFRGGNKMTKKAKQSKKATKSSKQTKGPLQSEEESDTATQSAAAEAPQATPVIPDSKVAVESQQAVVAVPPAASATPTTPSTPNTRSEAAKANIKEGLRLHQIAGRPTKQQLILVFGQAGYPLTWPKRTEKFGITPETFQAALARGVPAVPLAPIAKPTVEKPKETA
jgi:hypothetical protein